MGFMRGNQKSKTSARAADLEFIDRYLSSRYNDAFPLVNEKELHLQLPFDSKVPRVEVIYLEVLKT